MISPLMFKQISQNAVHHKCYNKAQHVWHVCSFVPIFIEFFDTVLYKLSFPAFKGIQHIKMH